MADIRYILSSNTPSTVGLSGTYDFRQGILALPTGSTPPTAIGSNISFIKNSGVITLWDGSAWKTLSAGGGGGGGIASGFYPTDATVSGGLLWWGESSGIIAGSSSGAQEWQPVGWGGSPKVLNNGRFWNYDTGTQPFMAAITPNGENALYGDATALRGMTFEAASGISFLSGGDQAGTQFVVARIDATSGTNMGIMYAQNNATNGRWNTGPINLGSDVFRVLKRDTAGALVNVQPFVNLSKGSWVIWSIVQSGTTVALYKNGIQVASSGQNVGNVSWTNAVVMGFPSGSQPLAGAVAELILMNSGVDDTARIGIENYLSSRHGIALER